MTGYTSGPHGSGYTFTIDIADDFDHDGLMNAVEVIMTTDPWNPDTDGDGLLDGWEVAYGVDPKSAVGDNGADGDPDRDNLTNLQEQGYKTHPNNFDTDGDLFEDDWEIAQGLPFDPLKLNDKFADTDGDGLTDFDETIFGTNPKHADTDGDGTGDGDEVAQNGQPNSPSDGGQPPSIPSSSPGGGKPLPNDGDLFELELVVGDPSGSHSERYDLVVTEVPSGRKLLTHRAPNYGVVETRVYSQFRVGQAYKFEIRHRGTDPKADLPSPDFDGTSRVSVANTEWALRDLGYVMFDSISADAGGISQETKILSDWSDEEDFKAKFEKSYALLTPVRIERLARNPVNGQTYAVGGLVTESQPTPEVDLEISSAEIASNGELQIEFACAVTDPLVGITGADESQVARIFLNGTLLEAVNLTSPSGTTHSVWSPNPNRFEFSRSVSVPMARLGPHVLRVQSSSNAAGNIGWDQVTVFAGRGDLQFSQTSIPSAEQDVSSIAGYVEITLLFRMPHPHRMMTQLIFQGVDSHSLLKRLRIQKTLESFMDLRSMDRCLFHSNPSQRLTPLQLIRFVRMFGWWIRPVQHIWLAEFGPKRAMTLKSSRWLLAGTWRTILAPRNLLLRQYKMGGSQKMEHSNRLWCVTQSLKFWQIN
ncbi:hypothetical protein [Verrucomicrobium spinosum]|uniref:hypothetical protein n=1 Tax=Verrucomicrobium spinosum TaxID=2736 RepID=UPI000AC2DCF4|nr:hypothetical protein [Verrucomicrobium spinosum]